MHVSKKQQKKNFYVYSEQFLCVVVSFLSLRWCLFLVYVSFVVLFLCLCSWNYLCLLYDDENVSLSPCTTYLLNFSRSLFLQFHNLVKVLLIFIHTYKNISPFPTIYLSIYYLSIIIYLYGDEYLNWLWWHGTWYTSCAIEMSVWMYCVGLFDEFIFYYCALIISLLMIKPLTFNPFLCKHKRRIFHIFLD